MSNSAIKSVNPKRPCSSWTFFCQETMKKLHEKNPSLTTGEKFKKSAEVWAKLTEKQKEKYVKMNEKDKVRYEKQKTDFAEKGWFTNTDGTKSNSAAAAAKVPLSRRFGEDVLLPKNPASAYVQYTKAHLSGLLDELGTRKVTVAMK